VGGGGKRQKGGIAFLKTELSEPARILKRLTVKGGGGILTESHFKQKESATLRLLESIWKKREGGQVAGTGLLSGKVRTIHPRFIREASNPRVVTQGRDVKIFAAYVPDIRRKSLRQRTRGTRDQFGLEEGLNVSDSVAGYPDFGPLTDAGRGRKYR